MPRARNISRWRLGDAVSCSLSFHYVSIKKTTLARSFFNKTLVLHKGAVRLKKKRKKEDLKIDLAHLASLQGGSQCESWLDLGSLLLVWHFHTLLVSGSPKTCMFRLIQGSRCECVSW